MAYAKLSTRNSSGLHPSLRGGHGGLGFLGDSVNPTLTADAAYQQAMKVYSTYNLNPSVMDDATWVAKAESQISDGQFDINWYSPTCAANPVAPLNLFATASGMALTTATVTTGILSSSSVAIIPAVAVPVIGWIIAGVGAIISLIGAIFAHHAAAVKRDLAFGCSALPAVNNALSVIATAVQNGNMKASDAANALPEIYSQFMSAGGASGSFPGGPSSIPSSGVAINDHPYCNGDCAMSLIVFAMVAYWQAQYQAMAATQAAAAAAAASAAAASVSSSAQSLTSPSVPASAISESAAGSPSATSSGLAAIPAWGWIALAALGAWAVL